MIDFKELENRENKTTPEEAEYRKLCEEYRERFGEEFGYVLFGFPSLDDAISEVRECLQTNRKQKKEKIIEGCVY